MRGRYVDPEKLRRLKERAIRFREGALMYFFGTLIKQTLEELGLWDDPPEEGDGVDDT